MNQRASDPEAFVRFSEEKATVAEISSTEHSSIVVWGVRLGQEVPAHIHPAGQDAWIILRGALSCFLGNGERVTIRAGQVDVAEHHQVHGAINDGGEDAVFLSIYSAPNLGWEKATP